jgi:pyruvate formate lyase activating enzyme
VIPIKGLQKLSLIDFPGRLAAVIFLPGCNFRCPYCQNPDLIKNPEKLPTISYKELVDFLKDRRDWLDGIVITGGEPTIWSELPKLIENIKNMNYEIKLDTNGSRPDMIEQLIKEKMIDYIAMDIKGPLEKYDLITKVDVNKVSIKKSVDIIKNSGLAYEFRTTVLPTLLTENDILAIGQWLKGSEKFVIQQFRPFTTLDPTFKSEQAYSQTELERFASLLKPFFKFVEIRS